MNQVRWKLKDMLGSGHTYGSVTKMNRISLGLEKSHINDAFVIAVGTTQARCKPYKVTQTRRNNRSLQLNRKGFKPSIRRERYPLQPNDFVRADGKEKRVKGSHCYGKRVVLEELGSIGVKMVELIKYGKGLQFLPSLTEGVSLEAIKDERKERNENHGNNRASFRYI